MLSKFLKLLFFSVGSLLFLTVFVNGSRIVFAQNIPNRLLGWEYDQQVTEVGKNAERARQLVYWIFTHSPSYVVPVFIQIWTISRNIVLVMIILVIVFCGLGYILSKQNSVVGPVFNGIASPIFGMSIPTLFFKIGVLLLYVVFSYIILLGLIQSSEVFSRFFAERYYGCDLFNIRFSGGGTRCEFSVEKVKEMEANYTDFIGYRDPNPLNQEAASTSLFLVRLTALTYNLFAIVLILRQVILWFLLMVSPFLALLMPFIFIRNTGWIWIGVFFQWLFYGPLVSLFLAGLVLIWRFGIPYSFDFSRVNQTQGQIFPTSVNILYGGPGQLLSPTNSANYVDTYAEYIISLVMLWVCLFLPWLLLRIFRDYCCDILRQNQAVLLSILDKVRGLGPPSPPPVPTSPANFTGTQFHFRKQVEEVKKTEIERLREVSKVNTQELTRLLSLSVSSLKEAARFEMSKKDQESRIVTLNKIANPSVITNEAERSRFASLRGELEERARGGDRLARQVLSASLRQPGEVSAVPISKEFPEIVQSETYSSLSKVTQLPVTKLREIIKEYSETSKEVDIEKISQRVALSEMSVQKVVESLTAFVPEGKDATEVLAEQPTVALEIARKTGLSEEKVREVVGTYAAVGRHEAGIEGNISEVSNRSSMPKDKVKRILTHLAAARLIESSAGKPKIGRKVEVSVEEYEEVKNMWLNHYRLSDVPVSDNIKTRQDWMAEDIRVLTNTLNMLTSLNPADKETGMKQVASILPFLMLGGFSGVETVLYLKAKLAAVKQIQEELERKEVIKKEVLEEEEETLIEVPKGEKKEEEKTMHVEEEVEASKKSKD